MDRNLRYNPRTHAIGTTPVPGIFEPPNICVQINEEWMSHIVGALETLVQPEYWPDVSYSSDTQEIVRLIDQLQQPSSDCPVPDDFNWRFIQDPLQSGDSPIVVYQNLISRGAQHGWYGSWFVVFDCADDCQDATQLTGIGESSDSIPVRPVGGHVSVFDCHLVQTVIGNVFNVETTDCLGTTQVRVFGGQEFSLAGEEIQHFQINALGPFFLRILWDTNWTCGQA